MQYQQRTAWLVDRLQERLSAYDFQHIPGRQQFRKKTNNGFQNIIYSVTAYGDLSIADLFMGIRIHAVEQLAKSFLEAGNQHLTDLNTIVTSVRPFLAGSPNRFEIKSPKDAETTVNQCLFFFEDKGFDLLENLSQLIHLSKLLNDSPTTPSQWSTHAYRRALRGLIAARLTYHADFEQLVLEYREELQKRYALPKDVERYEELVDFLRGYSVN